MCACKCVGALEKRLERKHKPKKSVKNEHLVKILQAGKVDRRKSQGRNAAPRPQKWMWVAHPLELH